MKGAIALLCAVAALDAQAELYRCVDAAGHTSYQQTPCDAASSGGSIELDTRSPDGNARAANDPRMSVGSQLERLAPPPTERTSTDAPRKTSTPTAVDRAKCARHRAQVARWEQAARATYRDRSEQRYREQMLEHHRAQVERYCGP
ncbi:MULTISPECIES: DUF4124 domain-containing protein [unclassified Marichromatium]|uniref:DUF4124 domain-containing protein n=1 Tax=unclassified Marichromatium TaxID=2618417 RepID=UPI000F3E79DF|nr:DUF4124 domain-containing protein [Marichromatium sp. AB31]RNE91913.1 DUF4124 domain-containing protein [Marichromatium sp. AB31]